MRTETLLIALTTFFATIGPADLALVFAALTAKNTSVERRLFALRGVLVAAGILLFFVVFGNALLALFGITLPALKTAGGVLLFLISIDMVFARHSGATSTTTEEDAEAKTRADISVFPLAMPLIAGPGAISATILLGVTGLAVVSRVVGVLLAALSVQFIFDGIRGSGAFGG